MEREIAFSRRNKLVNSLPNPRAGDKAVVVDNDHTACYQPAIEKIQPKCGWLVNVHIKVDEAKGQVGYLIAVLLESSFVE
jgi:hypothetical protein